MKNKYIELLCDSQVDKMQLLRHMFSNNNYDELNKIADRAPSTFTGLLSLSFCVEIVINPYMEEDFF